MTDDSLTQDELRAKTLKGLRWTVIARPTVEVLLLASMVVLARLVTPAEFGRFAVAAFVMSLALLPAAGLGAALVQFPSLRRAHQQSALAISIIAGIVLLVLTLVGADVIVAPVFGARTAVLVRLTAPGCIIAAFNTVPAALLQRQLALRRMAILDVVGTMGRAGISIALAVAGLQGESLVYGALLGTLVVTILNWIWAPQPFPWLNRQATSELLRFGIPQTVTALGWVGFQNVDYAIIGARVGALQSGYYFRAYNLGVLYQQKVSQVMSTVGFPVLSRAQTDADRIELRSQMIRLLTLLLFPLLVLLSIVAPVFVPWLFGQQWAPAVVPTQILAAGGAATLVIDAVGAVLMAAGRPRALVGYGWAHFIAYGGAVWIAAPHGIAWVAATAVAVHTAFLFVAYLLLVQGTGDSLLRHLWHDVGPATVSSVAMAAVAVPVSLGLRAAHSPVLVYLSAMLLVSGVVYVPIVRRFFPRSYGAMRTLVRHVAPSRRSDRVARPAAVEGTPAA